MSELPESPKRIIEKPPKPATITKGKGKNLSSKKLKLKDKNQSTNDKFIPKLKGRTFIIKPGPISSSSDIDQFIHFHI